MTDPAPRAGALFAGYLGLDLAVSALFGARLAWYSEIDDGACAILRHRAPDVPNVGDVTRVDWTALTPVEILAGGSPCQDLSHAGKRAGMTEGTRSNLWVAMREGIAQIRPPIVVWENVRGALSAEADSELVVRAGLLDRVRRRGGQPVLRAAGRVVGDLADLGYDTRWIGLPASRIGAPHGRFRVFLLGTLADAPRLLREDESWSSDERRALVRAWSGAGGRAGAGHPPAGVLQLG